MTLTRFDQILITFEIEKFDQMSITFWRSEQLFIPFV